MKAKVDADTCTGCEECCQSVADVFEMSDAGVAVVKADPVPAGQEQAVRDAASNCPASCIEVSE